MKLSSSPWHSLRPSTHPARDRLGRRPRRLGDVLIADGDVADDLIVVLDGQVQVVERRGQPGETVIATFDPSQFPGEIGLLTGQRAFLSAVASTAGRVLRVPAAQVRVLMAQELGLSELILRRFLLRHSILTGLGSGLTLVGSRFETICRPGPRGRPRWRALRAKAPVHGPAAEFVSGPRHGLRGAARGPAVPPTIVKRGREEA